MKYEITYMERRRETVHASTLEHASRLADKRAKSRGDGAFVTEIHPVASKDIANGSA